MLQFKNRSDSEWSIVQWRVPSIESNWSRCIVWVVVVSECEYDTPLFGFAYSVTVWCWWELEFIWNQKAIFFVCVLNHQFKVLAAKIFFFHCNLHTICFFLSVRLCVCVWLCMRAYMNYITLRDKAARDNKFKNKKKWYFKCGKIRYEAARVMCDDSQKKNSKSRYENRRRLCGNINYVYISGMCGELKIEFFSNESELARWELKSHTQTLLLG